MNWFVILSLACFGVLMGAASVYGLTERIEPLLWLFIAFASAYWIARNRTQRPFMHGLIAAVLMGVCNSIVQSAFFDVYLRHNRMAAESLSRLPGGIPGRTFVLVIGPAIGFTYGTVVGVFAFVATKLFKKGSK